MRPTTARLTLAALACVALPALASAGSYTFGSGSDDFEYALFKTDGDDVSISTSSGDWRDIQRMAEREKGPAFWFARDGREWIVRDAALVAEAERILEPVQEIGREQGRIGALQGRIGAQQGKIGARQGRLGAKQGALGARLSALAVEASWDGRESKDAKAERREIEAAMDELGEEMEELSRLMEPLAEQQSELGAQQGALGKKQAAASKKAGAELEKLADRAIDAKRAVRL